MDLLCVSVLCLLCLCMHPFIRALWSSAGKRLTFWVSFMVSNCEFVPIPLVSLVRCGTLLYRFLIVAPLLTFTVFCFMQDFNNYADKCINYCHLTLRLLNA